MEVGDRVIVNTKGWNKMVGFIVSVPHPEEIIDESFKISANPCYGVCFSKNFILSVKPEYLIKV